MLSPLIWVAPVECGVADSSGGAVVKIVVVVPPRVGRDRVIDVVQLCQYEVHDLSKSLSSNGRRSMAQLNNVLCVGSLSGKFSGTKISLVLT